MTSKTEICSAIKEGEEPLDTLRKGFDYIMANLAKGLTTSEYINLYTLVHDYCTDRTSCQSATGGATDPESASFHGWRLYKELKLYLTKHLRNMAATLQDKRGKELLELLIENWDRYTTAASIISGVMAYINRHWAGRHLVDNKPAHDTYTLSLVLWKEIMIVEASQLRENVIEAVIDLIKLERDGYGSEHLIIKNALDIFVSASTEGPESSRQFPEIYRFHFELVFIDRTVEYYTKKSSDIISSKSIVAYMHEVERIFEEERERMAAYLFKTTHEPLIVVLERTLIEDHSREIESEFYSLIKQDRPEEVRLTHKLLSCVPHSLRRLTHLFEYYSRTEGLEQIEKISTTAPQPQAGSPTSAAASSLTSLQAQPKKESASAQVSPQLYFNTIIQIHKKLSHIVHNALGDDYSFVNAMDKAFRDFINTNSICLENPKKSIELLVRYADGILRKDNKTTLSKDSIEENLNYVITVFKYIEDKDFFQKLYQKMFAKRLIYSVCIKELEEKMICLLRDACGVEYSGKLSRMYNDIEISAELCAGFREYMKDREPDVDLNDVNFLVGGAHWPLAPPPAALRLPPELSMITDAFGEFYCKRFSGRKLTWLPNLGKSELLANCFKCGGAPVTLVVSSYQLLILILYNIKLSYTWLELLERTNLAEDQLSSQVAVLMKRDILIASKGSNPLNKTPAYYRLNTELECTKPKIKIDLHTRKEHIIDSKTTQKSADSDRGLVMQAAAVRILKRSTPISENGLISEIQKYFEDKLEVTPNEVLDVIDILIQKEYILKTDGEEGMLKYLA